MDKEQTKIDRVEWNASYRTGIGLLDYQHKKVTKMKIDKEARQNRKKINTKTTI
jgi:hemerythrin